MKNIVYRVILKVSWRETYFEFDSMEQACNFATTALEHSAGNDDDTKNSSLIVIRVVDLEAERIEKEEKARKEAEEKAYREKESEEE